LEEFTLDVEYCKRDRSSSVYWHILGKYKLVVGVGREHSRPVEPYLPLEDYESVTLAIIDAEHNYFSYGSDAGLCGVNPRFEAMPFIGDIPDPKLFGGATQEQLRVIFEGVKKLAQSQADEKEG
jgi:hypothetical protein